MKYIITKPRSQEEFTLFRKIEESFDSIFSGLNSVDFAGIGLSPYNQRYLNEYLNNYIFYARFYSQVFIEGIRGFEKPVEDSVFVDYGGGSGFFSLLAKETGFKKVVYNDIYDVSLADAQKLSKALGLSIDYFIEGDVERVKNELGTYDLKPDLICSFEVVEHIYNLEEWFRAAYQIKGSYNLVFSSSANIKNPYISWKLKKGHRKAEFVGTIKTQGSKERDTVIAFEEIRKEIILNKFPELQEAEVNSLAKLTRGFNKEDIIRSVAGFLQSGKPIVPVSHPTNTCDPYTGNWAEHLIDQGWLKKMIKKSGFTDVEIKPGLYTFSNNKVAFLIKKLFNVLIGILGSPGLFFAPVYILKAKKKT